MGSTSHGEASGDERMAEASVQAPKQHVDADIEAELPRDREEGEIVAEPVPVAILAPRLTFEDLVP